MIQEIIVACIGLVVCCILAYKLYKFFFVKEKKGINCGCSNCHCNAAGKETKAKKFANLKN